MFIGYDWNKIKHLRIVFTQRRFLHGSDITQFAVNAIVQHFNSRSCTISCKIEFTISSYCTVKIVHVAAVVLNSSVKNPEPLYFHITAIICRQFSFISRYRTIKSRCTVILVNSDKLFFNSLYDFNTLQFVHSVIILNVLRS